MRKCVKDYCLLFPGDADECRLFRRGWRDWLGTATSSSKELLLGYIWQTADYPWLNVWRHVADGKPLARGLEFGTTGLPQPFSILINKPSIFGRPTFTYLDAEENSTRSYAAFLVKVPRDFRGVERVLYSGTQLVIDERGGGRELKIPADHLFR